MHRELVDQKRWISETQFLRALNICMILPGPEAQQLAIYIGWRLHGVIGGIAGGAFFVIPSIFVLVLWLVPFGALLAWRGFGDVLTQLALFFTQVAFVTFGGAYAVLSYMSDMVVNHHRWLDLEQMVQGLALAESTPGPLIMVTQHAGFVAAYQHATGLPPVVAGILGGLITTYMTFLPCFLFIFLGAPYIEHLSENRRLQAALVGVTAAVVGVIANLGVFFATHVLFIARGGIDWYSLLAALASLAVLRLAKVPVYLLVPIGAVAGMGWRSPWASLHDPLLPPQSSARPTHDLAQLVLPSLRPWVAPSIQKRAAGKTSHGVELGVEEYRNENSP
jgi:chromate transport protein ChrA